MSAASVTKPHGLPEEAYAVATASLGKIGPGRLRALLRGEAASDAWDRLCRGRHRSDPEGRWREEAGRTDVHAIWRRHRSAGIGAVRFGEEGYPEVLADDPEAPELLFFLGDLSATATPARVTVVGTRSATRYGLGVAAQLGAELGAAGVAVLSGLALGIDGAAHEGACAARAAGDAAGRPVAIVAGGLDDPYPRRHAGLWRRVAGAGAVLSECPAGVGNETWRFPLRNRLLAALAQVVVVVECHARGGSLHTVAAADRRGRPVGAVPGSIRSPASSGTNGLLADGAFPVRDTADVLTALSLEGASLRVGVPPGGAAPGAPGSAGGRPSSRPPFDASPLGAAVAEGPGAAPSGGAVARPPDGADGRTEQSVEQALEWEPCSLDQLLRRTRLPLAELAAELERLVRDGRVEEIAGGCWVRR